MRKFLLIFILFASLCSCYRTDLNRFVIVDAYVKLYELHETTSPENYEPKLTHKLIPISFESETNKSTIYLGMLHFQTEFVSDSSENCNVPFDGHDGKLDTLLQIEKLITYQNDSLILVSLSDFDDINYLSKYNSGKVIGEKNMGFNFLQHFYSIDEIIDDYNNKDYRHISRITYPILLRENEIAILKKKTHIIKTDLNEITIKLN